MEIEYVNGDVIACKEPIMLHGCNAQGVMGRGVAKAVKERLPWAYIAYREAFGYYEARAKRCGAPTSERTNERASLGTVVWAINMGMRTEAFHQPLIVGNMITQGDWESEKAITSDGRLVDYDAVRSGMQEVERFVRMTHDRTINIAAIGIVHRVAMPKIGFGLGRGKWEIISEIIETESKSFRPVVYLG